MNFYDKQVEHKRKLRPYIAIFVLMLIATFVSEPFYRDSLFEKSIELAIKLHKNPDNLGFVKVGEVFANIFGSYYTVIVCILITYNFTNISKTFILFNSFLISNYIASVLVLIYRNPFMYYSIDAADQIEPIGCRAGWANPSFNSIRMTAVYLTIWQIVFDNRRLRFKNKLKYISLSILIISIILMNCLKLLSFLHSINQIIFGTLIGGSIFFFIFYVFDFNLNSGINLINIIKFKFIYTLLIHIALIGILLIFYFFMPSNDEIMAIYIKNMNNSACKDMGEALILSNYSLICGLTILGNLSAILGLKFEYYITFKGNELNWQHYNYTRDNNKDTDSLLSQLSVTNETQWNHTTYFYSFIRCFGVLVLSFGILSLDLFNILKDSLPAYCIVTSFLCWNILNFCLFVGFKMLARKLKLANNTIFNIANEESYN